MATYRARRCPVCDFYVGYWLAKPLAGLTVAPVKSFCLNCSYQFAVRGVVRGRKSFPPRAQAVRSRGRAGASRQPARNYGRELRTVGQELERRGFTRFNLKCSGDSYFVWSTEKISPPAPAGRRSDSPAKEYGDTGAVAAKSLLERVVGVHLDRSTVRRLEAEAVRQRGREAVGDTGRRLSHLLRTVGEQVYRRRARLLAVSWHEPQVSVVVECANRAREVAVLRTDNLYDLWVRMYLQRSR